MIRIAAALGFFLAATVGFFLAATNSSSAQSSAQCAQLRQAVAMYGYKSARRHAMKNYGPRAVAAGDRCLKGSKKKGLKRR